MHTFYINVLIKLNYSNNLKGVHFVASYYIDGG